MEKKTQRGRDAKTLKSIEVRKKHVLARKHSRREESSKKIKHPLHKDEKTKARFSLDLDKICPYISDK